MAAKTKAPKSAPITHFRDFPENWKSFCYALVSCNYLLSYKTLTDLFEFYNFESDEKSKCYATLLKLEYIEGDDDIVFAPSNNFTVTRSYLGTKFKITRTGFVAITDEMTVHDVTTLTHHDLYRSASYFLFGRDSGRHILKLSYDYVLKLIVSDGGTFDHDCDDTINAIFDFFDDLSDLVFNMLILGDKKKFFNNVRPDFFQIFFLYFCSYTQRPRDPEIANKLVEFLDGRKLTDRVNYVRFLAWAKFQNFISYGHPEKYFAEIPQDIPTVEGFILNAVILFQKGQYADAVKSMRKALLTLKGYSYDEKSRRYFDRGYENFLYGLMLYHDKQSPASIRTCDAVTGDDEKNYTRNCFLAIFCALARTSNPNYDHFRWLFQSRISAHATEFEKFLFECLRNGLHIEKAATYISKDYIEAVKKYESIPSIFSQIYFATVEANNPHNASLKERLGMDPLMNYVRVKEEWEIELEHLIDEELAFQKNNAPQKNKASGEERDRIAYYLYFYEDDKDSTKEYGSLIRYNPEISLKLQHSKNGGATWSKGKEISIKAFEENKFPCMDVVDLAISKMVKHESVRNKPFLRGPEIAYELVGCDRVFDADTEEALEIQKGEVQLSIEHHDNTYTAITNVREIVKDKKALPQSVITYPKNGVAQVYKFNSYQYSLVKSLQNLGKMPAESNTLLTKLLEMVSAHTPVVSDLLKSSKNLKQLEGDSKVVLQLSPVSEDLYNAKAVVYPAKGSKLVVNPGEGQEFIATTVNNETAQISRKLKDEAENFDAVLKMLAPIEDARSDKFTWEMTTLQCLTMLDLVRGSQDCTVEWPEGAKLKVSKPAISFSGLNLAVNSMDSWFEVSGEVNIDPKTKMKVAELLRLIREAQGNFIALGDNEYVALSESLKKQLANLDKLSSSDKKKVQISKFNSGVLNELEKNGAKVAADAKYAQLRERIENAQSLNPQVPKKLNASLRDYQEEGFSWMMRLASWGAGAVLADDMGLGKTIQTISVLLSRAQLGPQLVVVPAALLINWRNELNRFAPSLKPLILNFEQERAKALKKVSKNSIVLVTYGVVTEETEALTKIEFATAVFDEAHNIKNRDTKAFKSCVKLHADFRIMLTGTPLQNHLTEIWSLFEVAVPGLLGSYNAFSERFVGPIEREHDHNQQRLLKRIVSPFILRRTKGDVLNELPEKTEITLEVELSDTEKAFYNQIREETALSISTGEINPMQALAALTKLRQAACSMELIDKKLAITSSKTQTFLELVDDLIENNHRALVFSQFTSHLAIIRRELEKKGIEYLYLDGSMSPKERMKLVDEFDEGEMPLFLISLKAGGTGLNLTAADYVIHLDPWWNPAIEDQASDRAYRIGQERQVTVYRLIAKGTVEDKIIKLHSTKKSLADALLEGTEMSARLGREEILELLQLAQD